MQEASWQSSNAGINYNVFLQVIQLVTLKHNKNSTAFEFNRAGIHVLMKLKTLLIGIINMTLSHYIYLYHTIYLFDITN